jgi:hypothetical protein
MDFGSDSDGDDAFRWDLFEQTALIQRRVNELFGFELKDKQVDICCSLYDSHVYLGGFSDFTLRPSGEEPPKTV